MSSLLNGIGERVKKFTINAATEFQGAIRGESQKAARYSTRVVDSSLIGINAFAISQMVFMFLVMMRAYLLLLGRMLYGRGRAQPRQSTKRKPSGYLEAMLWRFKKPVRT